MKYHDLRDFIAQLEEKGLVLRRQEWKTKFVSLTEEGIKIHDQVVPLMEHFQTKTFSPLTDEERTVFLDFLRKIEKG